jgi:hypothetical protein
LLHSGRPGSSGCALSPGQQPSQGRGTAACRRHIWGAVLAGGWPLPVVVISAAVAACRCSGHLACTSCRVNDEWLHPLRQLLQSAGILSQQVSLNCEQQCNLTGAHIVSFTGQGASSSLRSGTELNSHWVDNQCASTGSSHACCATAGMWLGSGAHQLSC